MLGGDFKKGYIQENQYPEIIKHLRHLEIQKINGASLDPSGRKPPSCYTVGGN